MPVYDHQYMKGVKPIYQTTIWGIVSTQYFPVSAKGGIERYTGSGKLPG